MDYFDWKPLKSFQNYLPSSIFEMSNLSIVKKKFKYVSKAVGKACLTNDTRVTDTGSILLAKKVGVGSIGANSAIRTPLVMTFIFTTGQ